MQNYYDSDKIQKRDHPLDVQRILYLYDMLNIVVITDEVKLLPIKENIIEKTTTYKENSQSRTFNKRHKLCYCGRF